MKMRQNNYPMPKAMAGMQEVSSDEGINKLWVYVVRRAYRRPAFATEENQQREIADFANEFASECYDHLD